MSTSSSSSVVVLDAVADADAAAMSGPAAERTQSTLGGQWPFRRLLDDHGVPKEYTPYLANGHAACAPPPDGSFVCVYADALDAGMRVPLHGFHAALLRHYGLAPAQLAPNAWRYVAAFVLLCRDAGVEPMLSVFQHFFSVSTHKGDAAGWHHFKPSHHAGSGRHRLFTGKMSRTMYAGWKSRFFFLQAPPDAPWPCPVKWGKPTRVAVRKPGLTTAAATAVEKLLDRVGDSGIDVAEFLSAGRTPELKKEPGTTVEHTRKRKTAQVPDAATSKPTATLLLAQMVGAELDDKEQELQTRNGEVARLNNELQALKKEMRAARDAHAAEVARLEAEIDEHAADVAQLGDDIDIINHRHAAEVSKLREELHKARSEEQAVRAQRQRELMESRQLVRGMHRHLHGLAAAMHELPQHDDDKDDDGGDAGLPPPAQ